MTELTSVVDVGDQLPSQQIARRIRARMAVDQITGIQLAQAIGLTQRAFSRRYRGDIEWSIDELSALAQALRMSFGELTDHTPVPAVDSSPAPGGGAEYAIRDSNPEPADFGTAADASGPELGQLLHLPRRRPSADTQTITNGGRGADVVRLEIPTSSRRATSTWAHEADEASS